MAGHIHDELYTAVINYEPDNNQSGLIDLLQYNVSVYVHAYVYVIKTHDSESRGQEEAGRTQRTSELFTRSTALKFVIALNKPP